MTLFILAAGLILLISGAEALVRGSSGIAGRAGVPSLVVGLTVVALGTSSPELTVSVMAAFRGQADIALGNVVGSNIFNVLLILGLSAVIAPLAVSRQLVRLDVPVMVGVSALAWLLAADGRVGRVEGVALVAGAVTYTVFLIRMARRQRPPTREAASRTGGPPILQIVLIIVGLALLVLGSHWMVTAAVAIARSLGLSELIIALTIVAAGTSLPEVASSVVAAIRGQPDIAVGNVVGSNILNVLVVLGASAAIAPAGVVVSRPALTFDVPVMVAVALACLPIFFTGNRIARWEGALFLAYYAAYTAFLFLDAQEHDASRPFGAFMLFFAVPLTTVTLAVLAWRASRARKGEKKAA